MNAAVFTAILIVAIFAASVVSSLIVAKFAMKRPIAFVPTKRDAATGEIIEMQPVYKTNAKVEVIGEPDAEAVEDAQREPDLRSFLGSFKKPGG